MPFVDYTPTPTQLVTLSEADGSERLKAATTNASLEQLADGIAWLNGQVDAFYNSSTTVDTAMWVPPANTGTFVYVDSTIVVLDVPSCEVGDLLTVTYSTNVIFALANSMGVFRHLRPVVVEDYGGADTVRVPGPRIALDGDADQLFGGLSITLRHAIITPGPARVMVQAGLSDLTGHGLLTSQYWSLSAERRRP